MAVNVLFKEILIADLPAEAIQEGKLMWVTDTYEVYFDKDATTRIRMYDGVMGSLADEYDPLLTYTLGSLVIYHGLLYKNTTAIVTPEAWDINHWTSVNLEDLIGKLGDLTTITKTNIISAINELNGDIGDLTTLTTTDKTSIVNAINESISNMEWIFLGQVDGIATLNLPNSFRELHVEISYNLLNIVIPYQLIYETLPPASTRWFFGGYYFDTSNNADISVKVNNRTTIQIGDFNLVSAGVIYTAGTLNVWYR